MKHLSYLLFLLLLLTSFNDLANNPVRLPKEKGGEKPTHTKRVILAQAYKSRPKLLGIKPLLPKKDYVLLPTTLSNNKLIKKNIGPDLFMFTATANKDSVAVGEEFELTVRVEWVDFGHGSAITFLPQWYKYALKVVMPDGFIQTGGNYVDFCSEPVNADNSRATFIIKGKFEHTPSKPVFTILRGFEGSNEKSEFIYKGEALINLKNVEGLYKDTVCACSGGSKHSARVDAISDPIDMDAGVTSITKTDSSVSVNFWVKNISSTTLSNIKGVIHIGGTYSDGTDIRDSVGNGGWGCLKNNSDYLSGPKKALMYSISFSDLLPNETKSVTLSFDKDYVDKVLAASGKKNVQLCSILFNHFDFAYDKNGVHKEPCAVQASFKDHPVTIYKDVLLSAPNSVSATPSSICVGNESKLSGTCLVGNLQWYRDKALTQPTSDVVEPRIKTSYYGACKNSTSNCLSPSTQIDVTITSGGSCGITATIKNNTSGGVTSFCTQGTISLEVTGCPNNNSVRWYADGTELVGGKFSVLSGRITRSSTFGVNCIDPNDNSEFGWSQITFTVSPLPAPKPTISPDAPVVTRDNPNVTLTANGCSGTDMSVKWFTTGGDYLATGVSYSATRGGYYAKCIRVCDGSSSEEQSDSKLVQYQETCSTNGIAPILSNNSGSTTFCASGVVNLSVSGCYDNNMAKWYNTSGNHIATGSTFSTTINSNQTFGVACQNHCTPSENIGFDLVHFVVNPYNTCHTLNPEMVNQTAGGKTEFCGVGQISIRASGCPDANKVQWWVGNGTFTGAQYTANITSTTTASFRCLSPVDDQPIGPQKFITFVVKSYSDCSYSAAIINNSTNKKTVFCKKGIIDLIVSGCPDNNRVAWYADGTELPSGQFPNLRGTITRTSTFGVNCINPNDNSQFGWNSITFVVDNSGCNANEPVLVNNSTNQYPIFCKKGGVDLEVTGCTDNSKAKWYKNGSFASIGDTYKEVISQTSTYSVVCSDETASNSATTTIQVWDFNGCYMPSLVNLTPNGQSEFCGSGTLKLMMTGCGNNSSIYYEGHNDDGTAFNTAAGMVNGNWELIDGEYQSILNYTVAKSGYFKALCKDDNGNINWGSVQRFNFKVNSIPSVLAESTASCVNTPFSLDASVPISPSNTGNVSFEWQNSAGVVVSRDQNTSIVAMDSQPSIYTVKFTDNKGCTATSSTIVSNYSNPTVTVPNPILEVCEGSAVTLQANASASAGKAKIRIKLTENTSMSDRTTTFTLSGSARPSQNTFTIVQKGKTTVGCAKCNGIEFKEGQVLGYRSENQSEKGIIKIINGCPTAWWADLNQPIFSEWVYYMQNKTLSNETMLGCLTFENIQNCTNITGCDQGSLTDFAQFSSQGGEGKIEIDIATISGTWTVSKSSNADWVTLIGTDLNSGSNLNTTSVTGGSLISYDWYKNNLAVNSVIPSAQLSDAGTYTVKATDARNCVGTATVDLTVFQTPNVPTITQIGNTPIYINQPISLEASGCTDCNVEWYEKVGTSFVLIEDTQSSKLLVKKVQAGTYTYVAKYKNRLCSSAFSQEFNVVISNCLDVSINEMPPLYVCENGTVALTISPNQSGDGTNYEWFHETQNDFGDIIYASTGVRGNVFYAPKGKYLVKSCLVGEEFFKQSLPTEVQSIDVESSVLLTNLTVETGSTLSLTGIDSSPIISGQNISYLWTEPTSTNTIKINKILTIPNVSNPNQEGKYTFSVRKTVGSKVCQSASAVYVNVNPMGCTIDFVANPTYTCTKGIGEITVMTTGITSGRTAYYRINGGDWQTDNVFKNLVEGRYLVEVKEESNSSKEYGSSVICYAISGSRFVDLDCSLLPQVACAGLTTGGDVEIEQGNSFALNATGCPTGATLSWTQVGTTIVIPNHSQVSPLVSTQYVATCSNSGPNSGPNSGSSLGIVSTIQQAYSCSSVIQVNVVPPGCINFYAGDNISIYRGESITLKAVNCSSTVVWKNEAGNILLGGASPLVSPVVTSTYTAYCNKPIPLLPCISTVTVSVDNSISCSTRNITSTKKVVKNLDEKFRLNFDEVNGVVRLGTLTENGSYYFSGSSFRSNTDYSFNLLNKLERNQVFEYSYNAGCKKYLTVKYLPYECSKFQTDPAHLITSGQVVTLKTTGCNSEITWKDITNNTTLGTGNPEVSPSSTTQYSATCHVGSDPTETCVIYKTIFVECPNGTLNATITPPQSECNNLLEITGCSSGIKKWRIPTISKKLNTYTEGGTLILHEGFQPLYVEAFCITPNINQSCGIKVSTPVMCTKLLCDDLINPTRFNGDLITTNIIPTVYKGESLVLVRNCGIGSQVNWRDLNTQDILLSGTRELEIHDTPQQTKTYGIECVFPNGEKCMKEYTIRVAERCDDFTVTSTSTSIFQGNTATLRANICPAQNVVWNTGNLGDNGKSTLTVSPTVTTTYTVRCTYRNSAGQECTNKTITIHVGLDCAFFKLTTKDKVVSKGASTTLTATGCLAENITWNTGNIADNGNLVINVTPLKNTTYTATCRLGTDVCTSSANVIVSTEGTHYECEVFNFTAIPENTFQGYRVQLITSGVSDGNLITWNNNLGTGISKIVYPSESTTYQVIANLGVLGEYQKVCSRTVNIETSCNFSSSAFPGTYVTTNSSKPLILIAAGCNGEVSWYNGGVPVIVLADGTFSPKPTQTTTYDAICKNGNSLCISSVTVKVQNTGILGFRVHPTNESPSVYTKNVNTGDPLSLTFSGCSGNVTWNNGKKSSVEGSDLTFYPNQTTTYSATCDATGEIALFLAQVGIQPCNFRLTGNTNIKSGAPALIQASGCSGNLLWDWSPKVGLVMPTNPSESTTYTATCSGKNNTYCQKSITVNVSSNSCFGNFIASIDKKIINKGDFITLSSVGCSGNVVWDNGGISNISLSPRETTVYTATCSNSNCKSSVFCVVKPSLLITTRKAYNSVELTVTGCDNGELLWDNDLGTQKVVKVTPKEITTYTAYCYFNDGTKDEVSTLVYPPCTDFTLNVSKSTVNKYETVNLYTSGCNTGAILWSADNDNKSLLFSRYSGKTNKDKLLQTTTYSVVCDQSACQSKATVTVLPKELNCQELQLTASKSTINTNCPIDKRRTTLTATGCDGGVITWTKNTGSGNVSIPIVYDPNMIIETPIITTTYGIACTDYLGNTSTASKVVTVESNVPCYNGGAYESGNTCLVTKAYIINNSAKEAGTIITDRVALGSLVQLSGSCKSGYPVWSKAGEQFSNGQVITMDKIGIFDFQIDCVVDGNKCNVGRTVTIEVDELDCALYQENPTFSGDWSSLHDNTCPTANGVSWYLNNNYTNPILTGTRTLPRNLAGYNNFNSYNTIYVSCNYGTNTCEDYFSFSSSGGRIGVDDQTCSNQQISFRTAMKKYYIQQFLDEVDKKNGSNTRTVAQGIMLSNCIINELNANNNFLRYQGSPIDPDVDALANAYVIGGSISFNNIFETSLTNNQLDVSDYNRDILPTYEVFKKDVMGCLYPSTIGTDELKIDNPFRCNVSAKKINFEGHSVFVGFDGNPVNITSQGKPLSFFGSEEEGHEGQIASFEIGAKSYIIFKDLSNNFIGYGYTNTQPHGINKDLFYNSEIERYTVSSSINDIPVLLKTNSFGYFVVDNGLESHEVTKQNSVDKVLSDCFFKTQDKCKYNATISSIIDQYGGVTYSQKSKERILELYNGQSQYPPLNLTFAWESICDATGKENPLGIAKFTSFVQSRKTEIIRLQSFVSCSLWTQNDLNLTTMEDLLLLTPTCKAQLITRMANRFGGYGCAEGYGCEESILELLKSGKGQELAFLNALKAENSIIAIENGLDDTFGNDNYTNATNILLDLCKVALKDTYTQRNVKETIVLGKINSGVSPNDNYNYSTFDPLDINGFSLSGNNISVGKFNVYEPKVRYNRFGGTTVIKADDIDAGLAGTFSTSNILDVYDPVAITFTDKISFLSGVESLSGLPTGVVPALYIRYLKKKQNVNTGQNIAINSAIVASYALGVGELATALRIGQGALTARTLLALGDLSSAAFTDVTNTESFKTFLEDNFVLTESEAINIQKNCMYFGLGAQALTAAGGIRYSMSVADANKALDAIDAIAHTANATPKAIETNAIVKEWMNRHFEKFNITRVKTLIRRPISLTTILNKINSSTDFIAQLIGRTLKIETRVGRIAVGQIEEEILALNKNTMLEDYVGEATSLQLDEVSGIKFNGDEIIYPVDNVEFVRTSSGATCRVSGIACFVAGTPVKVGNVTKPIELFELNDVISAYDHKSEKSTLSKVTKLFKKEVNKLAKVIIGGVMFLTTPEHPFFANGNYTAAKDLLKGDSVLTQNNKFEVVENVSIFDSVATVYNLEVAEQHNYFIGQAGLLVHNKCFITRLGTGWNKFKNALITLNVPISERAVIYRALNDLSDADLQVWLNDFYDTKSYNELLRIKDATDYKGILVELAQDQAKMQAFKEVINDRVLAYEKLSQGYYETLKEWIKRRMWEYVRTGKDFEDYIAAVLRRPSLNPLLENRIRTLVISPTNPTFNISDYHIYSQVQLNIPSTSNYFVADQILVKYSSSGNITEVIILENKLTASTLPTANQIAARNATGNFTVRSQNIKTVVTPPGSNFSLGNGNSINSSQVKILRVNSNGTASGLTDIINF